MKLSDVAKLLALCASFDQRTIGEADVESWRLLLERVPGLGYEEVQERILNWYEHHRERVMPSDLLHLEIDEAGFWLD